MYDLAVASFAVIVKRIPNRVFLKRTTFWDAFGLFVISECIGLLAYIFPYPPPAATEIPTPIWLFLVMECASMALVVFVTCFMINRYAKEKFSLKETFVLNILLTVGSGVLFLIFGLVGLIIGDSFTGAVVIFDIVSGIFGLYMLYITQLSISKTASISKSEAVWVIVGPILALIALWVAFILLTVGFANVIA